MPNEDEKKAFAARLRQALKRSPKRIDTPTTLATQFNLRHSADPVTPQAAQKWLSGTSLPTVDKIRTLAKWLNVPELWLRFGVIPMAGAVLPNDMVKKSGKEQLADNEDHSAGAELTKEEVELIYRLRCLTPDRRRAVENIVDLFLQETPSDEGEGD